jgi:hypothetical protein
MPDTPCAGDGCTNTTFISGMQDPEADHFCMDCYQPENPTTGWMRKEYFKRGLDEQEYSEFMRSLTGSSNGSKIDKWLQKKLGIVPPKKEKKSSETVNR